MKRDFSVKIAACFENLVLMYGTFKREFRVILHCKGSHGVLEG